VNVIPAASTSVIEREVDTCIALLQCDTAEALVLNETASDIWRLIKDGDETLESIVTLLARAYGASPEAIRRDVASAIEVLAHHGFLAPPGG